MTEGGKVLFGRGAICGRFRMGSRTFYSLVELGMPVKKVNKLWMCHTDAVEEWIRGYTQEP